MLPRCKAALAVESSGTIMKRTSSTNGRFEPADVLAALPFGQFERAGADGLDPRAVRADGILGQDAGAAAIGAGQRREEQAGGFLQVVDDSLRVGRFNAGDLHRAAAVELAGATPAGIGGGVVLPA
ncbi:hypothetical protein G6F63_015308 [Rhizopus arrhizus]|nr:hypothetical protein G6F63_015308 [Rhizopus arrhizus]